jgi:acetyl esterase/lipase
MVRAYGVGKEMDEGLMKAFGGGAAGEKVPGSDNPFSIARVFTGIGAKEVPSARLVYDSTDSYELGLDFYRASDGGVRPCVIVIHGGSWSGGDSRQLPELNSYLARKGYNVAAVSYRLAPKYRSPAPIEDVKKAMSFLRRESRRLGIDTTTFVLLGRSAGAQIALLAAYTLRDSTIKGVVSFYGPADMVWGYSLPANPLVMDSRKVMSDYLGGSYEAVPQNYYNSSPVEFVTRESPPTLMIHGGNDPLVAYEHNIRLIKKLKGAGVPYYLLTLQWATHGFDYTINGPGGQLSTYAVEQFLSAAFK